MWVRRILGAYSRAATLTYLWLRDRNVRVEARFGGGYLFLIAFWRCWDRGRYILHYCYSYYCDSIDLADICHKVGYVRTGEVPWRVILSVEDAETGEVVGKVEWLRDKQQ